ncbi:TonB-dependent receptor [Paracoccus denitrificans]|uniref:TonB-dependent receptor n=1 Tax=Paracoccus denitrificans TaxID=266 RepID=UPI001E4B8879|nr:TonB-dependent receptor [Paracoccus denitrificans]UFS67256.1 TonB-dependent receptor [Paracoccus denitrificans]
MPCHSSSRPSSPRRALSHLAFLAVTTALAGSLTPSLALAEEDTVYLGEITIFANYWEKLARKSATTATVLGEGDLTQPVAPDLDAMAGRSANTVFQRANSQERLVVRGMSAFDNALSDPVGYLVNGVALPMGTIQLPHFFGAENVTLLKGPQGTSFGRNSEAGLLDFDTIRPGSREGGEINLGLSGSDAGASPLGGNGSFLWSGQMANGPALAFGLEYARDPGVISNPVTGADDGGKNRRVTGFAAAEWDLQDGGYLRLTTLAEDQKFNKEQFRYISGPLATGRYESVYSDPSWERRRASVTALEYGTSFDGFDLTAITGFTTFDREFVLDFDGSPLPLGVTEMDIRDRTISQEIRLTSTSAGPLKWVLGVNAFKQSTDADFNLGAMSTDRHTEIDQTGAALYGFAEYAISERFRLGAGLRVDHISSDAWQSFTSPMASLRYDGSDSSTTLLPKLTLAYDLSDATTLHASYARGYMPAGYNYGFANSADSLTYAAEYSWNAEIGVKHEFANGAGLSLAAFHTTVKDKQITETIPGAAQYISNAGEAKSYGIEAELTAPLGAGWEIAANAGWQRARATAFRTTSMDLTTGSLVAVDWSGNALPMAPETTWGLALSHQGDVWRGRVSLHGSGGYWFDPGNTVRQKGFMTVDAEVSRKFGNGELTLRAKNLLDEEYYSAAASTIRGVVVEDGSPRTIGVNWKMTW